MSVRNTAAFATIRPLSPSADSRLMELIMRQNAIYGYRDRQNLSGPLLLGPFSSVFQPWRPRYAIPSVLPPSLPSHPIKAGRKDHRTLESGQPASGKRIKRPELAVNVKRTVTQVILLRPSNVHRARAAFK